MEETRAALYRWMTSVMAERDWTAGGWAKRAGITPTNLTRFLKDPVAGSLPSAETLGCLARAAGSEPRFLGDPPAAPVGRVPRLGALQAGHLLTLSHALAEEYLAAELRRNDHPVLLDRPASLRAFAVRIDGTSLNAAGILPGDVVALEPVDLLPPRPGDVVVALAAAQAAAFRWHPPLLNPVSTDPACMPVACDGAVVAGVAVQVVRVLRV